MDQVTRRFDAAADMNLRGRRLAQLMRRDPNAEGQFWYSVITTGVYCRPTCPARHALPENIRLHDTLAEARATGFRPCRRCDPEGASLAEKHDVLIQTACDMLSIEGRAPSSQQVASAVGLSRSHFHKLFRQTTGTTPSAFARSTRATTPRNRPPAALRPCDPVQNNRIMGGDDIRV
nr:Ada metal-binding domain-containing protein [uncultured Brevundimonas sp.]